MVLMDDQQTSFNHFCRVCKKGFMCASALGGHVRALEEPSGGQWSKRKRSTRAKMCSLNSNCPSSEEEEEEEDDDIAANCLVMLSNARVDQSVADQTIEEERRNMVYSVTPPLSLVSLWTPLNNSNGVEKGSKFECKACKKVFNSHQALGGHRASHKRVKGCFASRQDLESSGDRNNHLHHVTSSPVAGGDSKRETKVHECSICHRVFSSGQALGGHKRCHWITSNSDTLGLNFPAPADDGLAGNSWDPRNTLDFEVSTVTVMD